MKKKIIEWFEIEHELGMAKRYPGFAFQTWCQINEDKIKKVLDVVREKSNPSKEYRKFTSDIDVLKKKYCVNGEDGKPLLETTETGKRYTFEGENKTLFDEAVKELNVEIEKIVQEYVDQINEYYKYITEEEMEFNIKLLNFKYIPVQFFEDNLDKASTFREKCFDLIDTSEFE